MPTNWKYIKKLLEKEFLCEKLRGHITYDLTLYKPAPWYQQHFIMKHNKTVLLDAAQPEWEWDKNAITLPKKYEVAEALSESVYTKYHLDEHGLDKADTRCMVDYMIKRTLTYNAHFNGIYGVEDIISDIGVYLHSDIQESLASPNYFINALAILDRRCGKRTLKKLAEKTYTYIPNWLKAIYRIRFEAESIPYADTYKA